MDSNGNVYVTGSTYSIDFPTTTGGYNTSHFTYDSDVFVTKLDSGFQNLIASTYLGGSWNDDAYAMAIDSGGNVYVTGWTASITFPTTTGAYDTSANGGDYANISDAFLSRINSALSGCSYFISLAGDLFSSTGGTGNLSVTVESDCAWTVTNSVNWITITSGGNGSGNGTAYYSVSANTSTSSRAGVLILADQAFTITLPISQAGLPVYTLGVSKSGSGAVMISPGDINCEGDCAEDYASGTLITLTATPAIGWSFIGWSGCDSASGSSCYLAMDSTAAVTAIFAQPTSAMTITGMSPSLGTTAGGCPISVTGTGFQSSSMLFVGNMLSEQISVSSDTIMTAITPHGTAPGGGSPEPVNALVALNDQSSDPAMDQVTFTYVHPGDIRDSQSTLGSHDGHVSISEVQTVINMFLTDLDVRPEADSDCDGLIGINEVQQAINSFLTLP